MQAPASAQPLASKQTTAPATMPAKATNGESAKMSKADRKALEEQRRQELKDRERMAKLAKEQSKK
jgi:hypothetical protein